MNAEHSQQESNKPAQVRCTKCSELVEREEAVWVVDKWVCLSCNHKTRANRIVWCAVCGTLIPSIQTTRRGSRRVGQYCCEVVCKAK